MVALPQTESWKKLELERKRLAVSPLQALFAIDSDRFTRFQARLPGLLFDFSKQWVDDGVLAALQDLAIQQDVAGWRRRMFAGEPINHTEKRAVLHTALRRAFDKALPLNGVDVMSEVRAVHQRMASIVSKIRDGSWAGATGKPITDVVNIGIGGSDLGPRMVVTALQDYKTLPRAHFVANADADELERVFALCDPDSTLFVVVSKTFTTQETMLNAMAARQWVTEKLGAAALGKHMLAVSTNLRATAEFGLPDANIFGFWDWVGGRYSLWSAVGMSIALTLGMEQFDALRSGAEAMDEHFLAAAPESNLPLLMGLIGVWNRNFQNCSALAVLPYAERLRFFPAFLQQLEMESNGKSVAKDGSWLDYATSPVIFGCSGTVGQHSFYQMLHQGTDIIPADFVGIRHNAFDRAEHEQVMHAHLLAQAEALLRGRDAADLSVSTPDAALLPHRIASGNRPSTTLLLDRLDAYHLGMLIALYEHKVFVQGIIWDVNSFDQWGVELGKQLASSLLTDLQNKQSSQERDGSTDGLLRLLSGDR